MPAPPEQQPDQGRIVATLAAQCHVPIDDVAQLYERQRAQLASKAHITKFLHIFATRNVLEILHERGLDRRAPPAGAPGHVLAA